MSGSPISRREAIELAALVSLTTAFKWTPADARRASDLARAARGGATDQGMFQARFFTGHEMETVRALVDLVIPRDDHSGSATEAGVPEFMDFMMNERDDGRVPMRGGLAWLDAQCQRRYGKTFVACAAAERTAVLDDIAWPKRAKPEFSQGVAFFNMFRDLTASGYYSSKIGIADLGYQGNEFIISWTGCPDDALKQLDVRYDD